MRFLILTLSLLGFLVSMDAAKAGLSTTTRESSESADPVASADPAALAEGATQETEHQIGLDKAKRRAVQRRLTVLGFDTKVNGKFDESTRAVITRWQAERGYPQTGFLDVPQHKALMTDTVSVAHANSSLGDDTDNNHPVSGHGGSAHRHRRGGGGPGGLIGGMIGGLFGRR